MYDPHLPQTRQAEAHGMPSELWLGAGEMDMDVSASPESESNSDLLLKTSETIFQMARIARVNENDKGKRVFYSHLESHGFRFQHYLRRAGEDSAQLHEDLVNKALHLLASLNQEIDLLGSPYAATPESRLMALNCHWNEMRGQHDSAKIEFVRQWLMVAASHELRVGVDKALERCADSLDEERQRDKFLRRPEPANIVIPDINEPSYAVSEVAQSIFDALSRCTGCACSEQHIFEAKFKLGTYRKPVDKPAATKLVQKRIRLSRRSDGAEAGDLDFDLFLSMDQDWKEVCVQTFGKTTGFRALAEKILPRSESAGWGYRKVDEICKSIGRATKMGMQRLVLSLTSEQLSYVRCEKSRLEIDKTVEPISLSWCLERPYGIFTEKVKRILWLIMGYAVLHLHDTSWLQDGWDSTNIKFFRTKSRKTPLQPFIQIQMPETSPVSGAAPNLDSVVDDVCDDDVLYELNSGHRCPALISLAVVLIEVYFVKPFKTLADLKQIPLVGHSSGRITLADVDQVFEGIGDTGNNGWRDDIPQDSPLLTAIDNCLEPRLWEDDRKALDSKALKSRIYERVVRPLEIYLVCGFRDVPLDNIDKFARGLDFGHWGHTTTDHGSHGYASGGSLPVPIPTRTPSPGSMLFATLHPASLEYWQNVHPYPRPLSIASFRSTNLASVRLAEVNYGESQFFDGEIRNGEFSDLAETQKYLIWKLQYEKVYDKFVGSHIQGLSAKPVRIAVLDTGIDRDHPDIDAREENIKGKYNCYDEASKTVLDRNGHGTFTANLILDYAPHAELYVIKIADKENARPAADIVVRAINHAVDFWGVDIISMSFGWPSSDFEGRGALEAAIDNAYAKKVLMFAAAANSGGRLGRAYPASSPHVICVHSTNTDGSASRFSPTAEPSTINIATVGESVESAWPVLLCGDDQGTGSSNRWVESRSGTSYATPIVAGIAAFLLQYARLHLGEGTALALKRKERMEALLRRCADRGPNYVPRDGYFYVELSLYSHNLFGDDLECVNHEILKTLRT